VRRLALRAHGPVILVVWAYRLLAALVIAYPLARLVGATGVASLPDGDRALFAPGGAYLVEALRLGVRYLVSATGALSLVGAGLAVFALIPLAALVVALNARERLERGLWAARTLESFPPFVFLGGLTFLAQALLLFLGGAAGGALRDILTASTTERGADLGTIALALCTLLAVAAVGVVQDLARAEIVRSGKRGLAALGPALNTFVASPALRAWAGRTVPALLGLALAAWLATRLHLDRPGTLRVLAAWTIHQVAVLGWVVLRASWMARALDLVELSSPRLAPEASDGTAVHSAALDDPS
jgi:hypothetical protein